MNLSRKDVFFTHKDAFLRAAEKKEIKAMLADSTFSFNWMFGDIDFLYNIRVDHGKLYVNTRRDEHANIEYFNKLYVDFHEFAMGINDGKEAMESGRFKWKGHNRFLGTIAPLCKAMRAEYKKIVEKKVAKERTRVLEEREARKKIRGR